MHWKILGASHPCVPQKEVSRYENVSTCIRSANKCSYDRDILIGIRGAELVLKQVAAGLPFFKQGRFRDKIMTDWFDMIGFEFSLSAEG
jgi:hypothetical protein